MRRSLLLAALNLCVASLSARAHFVWIDACPVEDGACQVRVSFAEAPGLGEARLVDRLTPARAWMRQGDSEPTALALKPWHDTDNERGAMQAVASVTPGSSLEVVVPYGVFDRGETPVLLTYYAKRQMGPVAGQVESGRPSPLLDLDIVPQRSADKLTLEVFWKGQPATNCEVTLHVTDGEPVTLHTNAQGRTETTLPGGLFACRARLVQPDQSGEVNGKRYTQSWHIATLTFNAEPAIVAAAAAEGAAPTADAVQVLQTARQHRAVWQNFPGFRARMTVQTNDRQAEGHLLVSADGEVQLEGLDEISSPLIVQQLESLVGHRLPDNDVEGSAVWDPAQLAPHALGRRVVLEGNAMGSAYRIRDNAVREVERALGPNGKFVISVLDVEWNSEGKYLPATFTVNTWMGEKPQLQSSVLIRQTWTRVATFDLPSRLDILQTDSEGQKIVSSRFDQHTLLNVSAGEKRAQQSRAPRR